MDSIKIEPFCDAASEQRENLLYLLGRMRQIQAASAQPLCPSHLRVNGHQPSPSDTLFCDRRFGGGG